MTKFKNIIKNKNKILFSVIAFFAFNGISSSTLAKDFLPENYANSHFKGKMCFKEAAEKYDIPEKTLKAIAYVETRHNPSSIHKGNYGVMQINRVWSKELAKKGLTMRDMLDPCKAIMFGASLLSEYKKETPEEWKYIGKFNSNKPRKQKDYYKKVVAARKRF